MSTIGRSDNTQEQYKKHFDTPVWSFPALQPGEFVVIAHPPIGKPAVERLANGARLQLLPKALGLYQIITVSTYTLTVFEDGIHNTISVYRATTAPQTENVTHSNLPKIDKQKTANNSANREDRTQTCVVNHMVRQSRRRHKVYYVIHLYERSRADCTPELQSTYSTSLPPGIGGVLPGEHARRTLR